MKITINAILGITAVQLQNIQDIKELQPEEHLDIGTSDKLEIWVMVSKENLDTLVKSKFITRDDVKEINLKNVNTLIFYEKG